LIQEIVDKKARLGITSALYCYEEFESSDDEDDHHIDKIEEDKDSELIDRLNSFIRLISSKFEDVSKYV
jgi:uncharacterized membrane-anchored protein